MSGRASVSDGGAIPTDSAEDPIYRALKLFVGRGREWSCVDLATAMTRAGLKTSDDAVSSWIAGNPVDRRTPPGDKLLKLFHILGTDFTSKVLGFVGMGAYDLRPDFVAPANVVATLATVTAEFAKAGVDSVYCNRDRGHLEQFADAGIAVLEPFSTKRER